MIDMAGIEKLRAISNSEVMIFTDVSEKGSPYCDTDTRGYAFVPEKAREAIARIADQIEREHAEELAAAKRDLTDEAREAVERLRIVSHDDILRSANPEHEIVDELCKAVGVVRQPTYTGTFDAISDRLIELIEHGGKRDADVAALRELADELCNGASYDPFGYIKVAARIRKAVDGATVPDAENDAERSCAALMEWRDQVAGLLGIDCGSMADEVQDAIMAELDKRLMPPGMEWPRWEDGKPLCEDDAPDGVTVVSLYLDGSGYGLVDAILNHQAGERVKIVKRPEPEVLGADGEPIKAGETVWDSTSPNDPTSSTVWRHGGPLKVLRRNDVRAGNVICENDQGIPLDCCAADLTHAAPDTQERIDEDKLKIHDAYWGCCGIVCGDCPAVIDGMKPYEYYGVLNCRVAQGMDIARRKHELDAKTMGGAR